MFTGIVEEVGIVKEITLVGQGSSSQRGNEIQGKEFSITTSIVKEVEGETEGEVKLAREIKREIKLGSSISVSGVCSTATKVEEQDFSFFASAATLSITNLDSLKVGDLVNLELALRADSFFDGHYVTGHVDKAVKVSDLRVKDGNTLLSFPVEAADRNLLIPKGSVTLNGISLTIYQLSETEFTVMIIPFTWQNTNLREVKKNDMVNLEFDILGKYFYNFYKNNFKGLSAGSESR